jgi:Integrase core domain
MRISQRRIRQIRHGNVLAHLKTELAWTSGRIRFESRAELRTALLDYIDILYNGQRHQAALDHQPQPL